MRRVVVLRGAGVWAPAWGTFLARSLMAPAMVGVRGQEPPLQGLAPADAVSALALATTGPLNGIYNVAPDDWVGARDAARAAGRRRLEVPQRVAQSTADRLWQAGMSAATAGELAFQTHPWVLGNAKLRQAGWAPTRSSAEAFAEAGGQKPAGSWSAGSRSAAATSTGPPPPGSPWPPPWPWPAARPRPRARRGRPPGARPQAAAPPARCERCDNRGR